MNQLHIVVTMDCERPNDTGIAKVTGPVDWAFSARAMDHYSRIAHGFGFPVSYFCHPEVAHAHPDLLATLSARGDDVEGLHLHPWKYARAETREHLGHLSDDAQRRVVELARDDWADAMGRLPRYFRPGTFSANDATFRILKELGFVGGSLSVPGRVFPDMGAVWAGCSPDPHLAHESFRIVPGAFAFPNMPLTVDTTIRLQSGIRSWHPDLRPDQRYEDLPEQVDRVIRQIAARAPAVPVFNIVTHNDHDYSETGEASRGNLIEILRNVRSSCEASGIRPVGSTIADISDAVLKDQTRSPSWVAV